MNSQINLPNVLLGRIDITKKEGKSTKTKYFSLTNEILSKGVIGFKPLSERLDHYTQDIYFTFYTKKHAFLFSYGLSVVIFGKYMYSRKYLIFQELRQHCEISSQGGATP